MLPSCHALAPSPVQRHSAEPRRGMESRRQWWIGLGRALFVACALARGMTAQELPAYELPDAVKSACTQAGTEPAALLRTLSNFDPAARADMNWDGLTPAQRVALVRWGIRSDDRAVAFGAAARAHWSWLDRLECKRVAAIGTPDALRADTPFDLGEWFDVMDGEDALRLLSAPLTSAPLTSAPLLSAPLLSAPLLSAPLLSAPLPMPRENGDLIGPIHQRLGPEHLPRLLQLARSDDLLLRTEALRYVLGAAPGLLARETLADLVLAWPISPPPEDVDPLQERVPFVATPVRLRPDGAGWPSRLAAVVERAFFADAAFATDETLASNLHAFVRCWAMNTPPGEADLDLLLRLGDLPVNAAREVAARGLLVRGGERAVACLRRLADDPAESLSAQLALAALVARDDGAARRRLAALAREHATACALWLHVGGDRAIDDFLARVAGDDADARLVALEQLSSLPAIARDNGLHLPDVVTPAVRRVLAQHDGRALALVLDQLPAARSTALCEAALQALDASNVGDMPLGVLELHDAARLRQRLGEVLTALAPGNKQCVPVASALLALGDDVGFDVLWSAANDGDDGDPLVRLAARGGARARTRLVEVLRAGLPAAPAAADWARPWALLANHGLHVELASALAAALAELGANDDEPTRGLWQQLADRAAAGDVDGGVNAFLAAQPFAGRTIAGLGFRDLPSVRAYLVAARQQREHGAYLWAIGELARLGDASARAEIDTAIAQRHYRWLNEMEGGVMVADLARVPVVLPQLDTNCCTHTVVADRLTDLIEFDFDQPEPRLDPALWATLRGRYRWSKIAHRYLLAPI